MIEEEELRRTEDEDSREAVALQLKHGMTYIANPQLNWQDLFRPLLPALDGVEIGPLTRWFDNNTFYRQPVVTGRVELDGAMADRYLAMDHLPEDRPRKITLPGPWTFARLASNKFYGDGDELLRDLGDAIGGCALDLASRGFDHIQFSEPALVTAPPSEDEWDATVDALGRACGGLDGTTSVHTFFGDASVAAKQVMSVSTDVLGIDLYATDLESLEGLRLEGGIALGCVDARNSLVEEPADVVKFATAALDLLDPSEAYITPNCDLDFLPRDVAEAKVSVLGEAARELEEVV